MISRFARLVLCCIVLATPLSAHALSLHGKLEQGGLVIGKAPLGQTLNLDGTEVPVGPDGTFVLGFGRDAKPHATLTITDSNGYKTTQRLNIAKRDWRIQRINGLPKAKVTPPPEVYTRIKADSAAIRKVRNTPSAQNLFGDGFTQPAKGIISGVFGSQRILNDKPRSPHSGVDIAAPTGTPVHAAADGIVSLAHPDMYYTGKSVMIDHGLGLQTVYIHMHRYFVKVGDRVKRGDVIGEIGTTGRSTGPHLHWGVSWLNQRLDPETVLKVIPANAK